MQDVYTEHTVSAKIALYSHDFETVLVMKYSSGYGLPGGHLEANELPREALVRELDEELGVTIVSFEEARFFLRSGRGSSVILAYTGIAPSDIVLQPSNPKKEIGVWVNQNELVAIEDISDEYKKLALENWPTK